MKIFKISCLIFNILLLPMPVLAQSDGPGIFDKMKLSVESSTIVSSGDYAPLWLSSNKYGLSSVEPSSNYERVSLMRGTENDSLKSWRWGYGLDLAVCFNSTSNFVVQQAYVDLVYKKLKLTAGAKEQPIDLRNNQLTSGGLGIGINARPIPQLRLESDYFSVPGTNHWWKMKFRGSYGMTTDGSWQKDFHADSSRYTNNVLYHEKALYWKFGREEKFSLTFEIGLQMATMFGGTSYNVSGRGHHGLNNIKHENGFSAFWDAFVAGGNDVTDGVDRNTAGNHLGSYNMALSYVFPEWKARAYFERYFEDQSMLTLQYGIYDHLLGFEVELPKNPFVNSFVLEHISTKDQSGAVYHDKTASMPDKMNGRDNYYYHLLYTGWQHWGMALGHPLITSPIYNENNVINFHNNRIMAWHFGLNGQPTDEFAYRVLLTFTENWGTYITPFDDVLKQNSYLFEVSYQPKRFIGWSATLALAYDDGEVLGNSFGGQLRLRKTFNLSR